MCAYKKKLNKNNNKIKNLVLKHSSGSEQRETKIVARIERHNTGKYFSQSQDRAKGEVTLFVLMNLGVEPLMISMAVKLKYKL